MKNGRFVCGVRRKRANDTAVISVKLYGSLEQTFQNKADSYQLLAISLSFAHMLTAVG